MIPIENLELKLKYGISFLVVPKLLIQLYQRTLTQLVLDFIWSMSIIAASNKTVFLAGGFQ